MDITKQKNAIKFSVFVIFICLIWYLGRFLHIDTQRIQDSLAKFSLFYSGILYIILYIVITFFIWFSKDLFWLIGAVLFGAVISALLVLIAETINAFILFYLARYLGRAYVEHSLKEKHKGLDERLGKLNFAWLFIFRAAPLIPYRFLDLAAGLTRMPFKRYLAAVIFGSALKIFWIQYIIAGVGKSIFDDPSVVVEYFMANKTLFIFSLIYPALVIAVAFKIRRKD